MPQAVKIVSQFQEQGLAALRKQAPAGGTTGQLAFGDGEDGFNQRATTVFLSREVSAHLGTNAMNVPHDAQSMQLSTDEGVVPLRIEFGIGQHPADRGVGMGSSDHSRQIATIVPRSLTCRLRQDELSLQIDDGQPLQPMPPRQGWVW